MCQITLGERHKPLVPLMTLIVNPNPINEVLGRELLHNTLLQDQFAFSSYLLTFSIEEGA
jgi:hypothetical protein